MRFEMDRDLPEGTAIALGAAGQQLAVISSPHDKPPPGTVTVVLSVEDYGKVMRFCASQFG